MSNRANRADLAAAPSMPKSTFAAAFIISMPPPNITGAAHLGHGSTYTPMDVLTRYHRCAGTTPTGCRPRPRRIATEAVLVRELAKRDSRATVSDAMHFSRALGSGASSTVTDQRAVPAPRFGADWQRERFTMDPELSAAVTRVFIDLYNDG